MVSKPDIDILGEVDGCDIWGYSAKGHHEPAIFLETLCPECAREVAAALHEAIGLLEQQQQAEGGERGCGSKSTQLSAERCI